MSAVKVNCSPRKENYSYPLTCNSVFKELLTLLRVTALSEQVKRPPSQANLALLEKNAGSVLKTHPSQSPGLLHLGRE